ncbi:rRNA methyltransferase [Solibacillus sp. FSL H8-0538]|uniref:rRNA methyltransferase n=1 Tax=Solibacillus sp. FSL H8-0538 TaxID=2921400 RepID=UPI0030F7A298
MWVLHNGKLIHSKDQQRHRYKTRLKPEVLEHLKEFAKDNDTEIGYVIENGIENLLQDHTFTGIKQPRCAKQEFRTTMDADLFQRLSNRSKELSIPMNQMIEAAINHIDMESIKSKKHRYRIEKLD